MKNQNLLIVAAIVIAFSGVGFFGGMKYQQSKAPRFNPQNRNGQMTNNRQFRGGQILGDIIAIDDKSITVKLTDGSSKIILVSGTTSINQATTATMTDLKVGTKVAAFGQTNTDGSVSAANIQINPVERIPQANTTVIPIK
jgi:hypothetical protein